MQLLLSSFAFITGINKWIKKSTPTQVGKYKLTKDLTSKNADKKYTSGVYSNGKKKVFIKTWTGHIPDRDYYMLKNEQKVSKIVEKYISKSSHIRIPKVIESIQYSNHLSVVFEYIDGTSATNVSVTAKNQIYKNVFSQLKEWNQKLSNKDKNSINHQTSLWYLKVLTPKLIMSKNISLKNKIQVLKDIVLHISKKTKNLEFCHGDLLPNNIILSGKNIYLIDFGQSAMSFPDLDKAYLSIQPESKAVKKLLEIKNRDVQIAVACLCLVSTRLSELQEYYAQFI